MMILRKLKTAKNVMASYGPKEALGLVGDNLSKLFSTAGRAVARVIRRIAHRIIAGLPRLSKKMRVLYVTTGFEAFHSQTVRYRVHNFRQALRGQASTRFELAESADPVSVAWADIIILMRTTWTPKAQEIISAAEKLSVPVVFDIDDIIFLPEYAKDYCRALGDESDENIKGRTAEFEGFEKTFGLCRYATASTPFIADKMKKAGKPAFVIHNGLNKKQLRIARHCRRVSDGTRAIGYLSGTKTHDRDFLEALPALSRIAEEYPDVRLRLAGYLDLSALPKALAEKTRPACYMSWARLMKYGAQNDINIAPLDAANPFCNAKSELKYFEAAAVGVPTVASATDTFSRCIKDGYNGMLAKSGDDWYRALKKLLDNEDFYKKVSQSAKKEALEKYCPQATAYEALTAYKNILDDFKSGAAAGQK